MQLLSGDCVQVMCELPAQKIACSNDSAWRTTLLLVELDGRNVERSDHKGVDLINVASDESLVRSLDDLGIGSLEPSAGGSAS